MKKSNIIVIAIIAFTAVSCSLIPEPTPHMILEKHFIHKERHYHDNLKSIAREQVRVLTIDKINEVAKAQIELTKYNPELRLMGTITQSSSMPFIVDHERIAKFAQQNGFEIVVVLEVKDVKGFDMISKPQEDGSYKYSFKIREGKGYQFAEIFLFSSQKPEAVRMEEAAE